MENINKQYFFYLKQPMIYFGIKHMNITHFTNTAYLITYVEHRGDGSRFYGIMGIFNKKPLAEIKLQELNDKKEKETKYSNGFAVYELKEVTLNVKHELFQFIY